MPKTPESTSSSRMTRVQVGGNHLKKGQVGGNRAHDQSTTSKRTSRAQRYLDRETKQSGSVEVQTAGTQRGLLEDGATSVCRVEKEALKREVEVVKAEKRALERTVGTMKAEIRALIYEVETQRRQMGAQATENQDLAEKLAASEAHAQHLSTMNGKFWEALTAERRMVEMLQSGDLEGAQASRLCTPPL
ncbi:hypothetical protein FA13DRAFT_1711370 [Coprinellus micaceus]|uniref:Uncharacterized protein n=1 Tax=Coprinellus micaceus TaxID=71717 RepID=A0A4Y7T4A9_COPMI|nr:hypothetical protein FA13DRAFT_1711370 [Coprinellus micaceus]